MMEENDSVRTIAERIARRVSRGKNASPRRDKEAGGSVAAELSAVRGAMTDLQKRLTRIESQITRGDEEYFGNELPSIDSDPVRSSPPTYAHSPWLSGIYFPTAGHPSQDRFDVKEATVSELVDFFESEKTCNIEPGNKPCDHCSMCSSRGF